VPFYSKTLRLPIENYRGRRIYFLTFCCEKRRRWFAAEPTGRWIVQRLLQIAANYNFLLHAYCAMPDHLHVLVEATLDHCNLLSFANMFKQQTGHQFKQEYNQVLWQKRFYDHVLRPGESIESVACYIWMNPVREALCAEPSAYPLSGSQTIEWIARSRVPTAWLPPWKTPAQPRTGAL
jgi:putative transposase